MLRKAKCIFDDVNLGLAAGNEHLGDIEAEQDIRVAEQFEPFQGSARDELLLERRDGFGWRAKLVAPTGFDFDKNQGVLVPADDIDLATFLRAEVPVENFVTGTAQVPDGDILASPAQLMPGIREGRVAPPEPGESCGDESDKAHWRAVYQGAPRCHSLCVGKSCNRDRGHPSPP